MKEQALFCDGTERYVDPIEPGFDEKVTLRFRTAKDDDIQVKLVTAAGRYDMEKEETRGEFDFYKIVWRLGEDPFYYSFEICEGVEK